MESCATPAHPSHTLEQAADSDQASRTPWSTRKAGHGMAWGTLETRRSDAYLQPTHLLRTGVLLANDRWPFEFNFDRDRSRTPALAGADTTSRLFPFQPIISDLSGTTSSVIKLAIIISSRRGQEQ
jgi:hypothetical protein